MDLKARLCFDVVLSHVCRDVASGLDAAVTGWRSRRSEKRDEAKGIWRVEIHGERKTPRGGDEVEAGGQQEHAEPGERVGAARVRAGLGAAAAVGLIPGPAATPAVQPRALCSQR